MVEIDFYASGDILNYTPFAKDVSFMFKEQ